MKTAEEWSKFIDVNPRNETDVDAWFERLVSEIQLDAAKWGAEQAAIKGLNCKSPLSSYKDAGERVLTFASNLTIDQLPK